MTRKGLLVIVLAGSVIGACNRNNDRGQTAADASGRPVGTAGQTNDNVTRGDRDFIHDVAIANMAEIDLGTLASQRAVNPQVKKFAQMMVDDHTPADERLNALARQNNIERPAQIDDTHRSKHDDLAKKQSGEFDRDYIAYMVDAHNDLVDKLESRIDKTNLADWKASVDERVSKKRTQEHVKAEAIAAEKSDNPVTARINEWAASVYPIAYAHLQTAKALDRDLKNQRTH